MLKQVPYHLHTWWLNRTDQRPRAWGGQNGSMWANCLKRKFYKGLRHWCSVLHLVLSLQRGDPAHNRVGWEGGKLVGQKVPPITLWQKGSLWRGLGPCRDLFGVLRPYWYFRVPGSVFWLHLCGECQFSLQCRVHEYSNELTWSVCDE